MRMRECARCLIASLATLTLACAGEEARTTPERRGEPHVWFGVVGWLDSTHIIFQRVDTYGGGDAFETTCDGAGLYVSDLHGQVTSWRTGAQLCDVLRTSDISLGSNNRDVVFAPTDSGTTLGHFDLETQSTSRTRIPCTQVRTPVWSPSGHRIALAGACGGSVGRSLWLVDPDGSNGRHVGAPGGDSVDNDPTWSPDERALAVQQGKRLSLFGQIMLIDSATGRRQRIATGIQPAWHPSAPAIAYVHLDSTTGARPSLRVVRTDGTGDHKMISDSAMLAISREGDWFSGLTWSPDGRWLGFASSGAVWIVNINGIDIRAIATQESVLGSRRRSPPYPDFHESGGTGSAF